jgi:hypothetical protein
MRKAGCVNYVIRLGKEDAATSTRILTEGLDYYTIHSHKRGDIIHHMCT